MTKVMTGSRGKLLIDGVLVGTFDSVSVSFNLDVEPVYLLGRATAAEITPLNFSPVNVSANGFRIVDHGPNVEAKFPKLQDFLQIEGVTIEVIDRSTGKLVMKVAECVPTSYSTGFNSRATSRTSQSYIGIRYSDESGDQAEVDPTELP